MITNVATSSYTLGASNHLLNIAENECIQHLSNKNIYKQCIANALPSLINYSMYSNPTDVDAFRALSPPSIVVMIAGNYYPEPVYDPAVRSSRNFDAIIVGSLAPDGVISSFSQEHEEVHIVAPSDNSITTSTDENRTLVNFGGTVELPLGNGQSGRI